MIKAYKFHIRCKGLYIHGTSNGVDAVDAAKKLKDFVVSEEKVYRKDRLYITYEEVKHEQKLEGNPS
jgi:hypothetical protein